MNSSLVITLTLVLVGSAAGKTQETVDRLDLMRKTYETELAKIDLASAETLGTLRKRYAKALVDMEHSMQDAGRLGPLLSVKAERDRFKVAKRVENGDIKLDPAELAELQKAFLSSANGLDVARARKVVNLASMYEKSLNTLRTRLTKAGDIDSAIIVDQTLDALHAKDEQTAAQFILADAATLVDPAQSQLPAEEKTQADQLEKGPEPRKGDKQAIRKRYEGFCEALEGDDLDAVIAYIDPRFVARVGTGAIKPYVGAISAMVKGAKAAGITMEAGRIYIDDRAGTATNIPSVHFFNDTKDGDPTHWVYVEEEWYIDSEGKK